MMAMMAHVLVMDTCGERGYVAVLSTGDHGAVALSERRLGSRATQEELLPAVQQALMEAAVLLGSLRGIAVVRGPGSFTGVRVGLAAAKGLCEAASLPLLTLSRLEVLASAVGPRPVWAWLQAGRGDVYIKRFESGSRSGADETPEAHEANPGAVCSQAEAAFAAGQEAVAMCEEALWNATPEGIFVSASEFEHALRAAAATACQAERWSDVALSDALYLRVPDAELALRARQG